MRLRTQQTPVCRRQSLDAMRVIYFLLLLSLLIWREAAAQLAPAGDFFNRGAQLYISNNIPAALERVELGRKMYPDDTKLKKLEELLKQKQQQQQQDQQQQSDQQKKPDDQKPQQNQKPDSAQPKPDGQKPPEQKNDPAKKPKDEKSDPPPTKPGEMTPEEAKRLLDAQKGNEQLLQFKPEQKPRDNRKPLKDW